jgi:hypothetical protein
MIHDLKPATLTRRSTGACKPALAPTFWRMRIPRPHAARLYLAHGGEMPKSLQIFLASSSLTSVCRGTADRRLFAGFSH